jgi:excisionase family DNA binding protein
MAKPRRGARGMSRLDEPIYLEAEVAEMLRMRLKVIQRERYPGRLPIVRIGKHVRIRASDLEKYLAAQCHEYQGEPASSSEAESSTSSTLTAEAAGSAVRRGQEIAAKLKQR